MFLKISQNSQETPLPESEACNFIKKETLAQVFSCKFCEIIKNTFLKREPPLAAEAIMSEQEITNFDYFWEWICKNSLPEVFSRKMM